MTPSSDQVDVRAKLADYRASIDNIDAALIHMLAERFRCTKAVGVLKAEHGLPPADPAREGQQIAGVCNGLAAYSELRVDWVRTLFFFATLLTLGAFTLVYVALVFILPVASTGDSYQMERR